MPNKPDVSSWKVTFKVITSWWWVGLSLLTMVLFLGLSAFVALRLRVPPQVILQAFFWMMMLSVFAFFFSEFLINLFMGARKVDPEKYPNFVRAMQEIKQERRMWFQPRMRILPMEVPNAMAYGAGFFGQCCIAVTPRLYHMLADDYPAFKSVVAHEYGHIWSKDIGLLTVVGFLAGAVERLRVLVVSNAHAGFTALLWAPAILLWLVSKLGFGILRMAIAKEREFAADALSAYHLGSPDPMIRALRALETYSTGRRERLREKERKKAKKQADGDTDAEDRIDKILRRNRYKDGMLSDLMISHPHTDARVSSLESLRP